MKRLPRPGLLAVISYLLASHVAGAPAFRLERDVLPGGPGLNRIEVDATLLAGSAFRGPGASALGDLRFFTSNGAEVPYLLVGPSLAEPTWLGGALAAVTPTRTTSGFELDLGSVRTVDRVRVAGLGAPFLKRVRLEGSGDRVHWLLLVAEGTLFDLPQDSLRCLELGFPRSELRFIRLQWDDASSGRVGMPTSASARLGEAARPDTPLRSAVSFSSREAEPGKSRFRIRLPGVSLPITALELSVPAGNLMRNVTVSEARLSGSELRPVTVGAAVLRQAVQGGTAAASLQIPVASPQEAELDLVVENGPNPPLQLTGVTAIFLPQPTIVLEAPGDGSLVARFGAPGLLPPQYDLEAEREAITRKLPAQVARWGERRERPDAATVTEAERKLLVPGAALDATRFASSRELPPSPAGLTAVRLDVAVLAGSHDVADVRIVDTDGLQVPYIVELMSEPLSASLPALIPVTDPRGRRERETAMRRASVYRVDLPARSLPAGKLVVESPVRVFERAVEVFARQEGWQDRLGGSHAGPGWRTLARVSWGASDPEGTPPCMVVELPHLSEGELYLAIDDGDNSPLVPAKPRLLLPAYRLRFLNPEHGGLRLLYGNPEAVAPRYDLALLSSRLLGAAANEITLPATAPGGDGRSWQGQRTLLWVALIVVVLALLALATRLLRGVGGSQHAP